MLSRLTHLSGRSTLQHVRSLHAGFAGKKLKRHGVFRDRHLDNFQPAPPASNVKHKKEQYLKEIMDAKGEIAGLFADEQPAENSGNQDFTEREAEAKEYSIEAMRIYRLLKPEAPVFYKEEAMTSLQSKMNEVLLSQAPITRQVEDLKAREQPIPSGLIPKQFDTLQFNLPVVNPRAFLLALEAATQSLADDLDALCQALNVVDLPSKDEPMRFRKLLDRLFDSFKLRKDPAYVDEWMFDCWPRIRPFMPKAIASLPARAVGDWLKGHLARVIEGQKAELRIHLHRKPQNGQEMWYDISEDFVYDDYPMSDELVDERNMDFPLHKAGEYLKAVGQFLSLQSDDVQNVITDDIAMEFQKLIDNLSKIGLSSWLTMDIAEIEKYLPRGEIPVVRPTDDDLAIAKIMLRAAARGKGNLLDFEALDPYKMLHGFDSKTVTQP
eukprot:GHVQ01031098.1.p1 GENE.GHVQ01031098.1~~GHVQ01031098.1.p1  ORF type:complete len:438 (+),score=57.13 GHVQ01031098.1:828-2141(+)